MISDIELNLKSDLQKRSQFIHDSVHTGFTVQTRVISPLHTKCSCFTEQYILAND